MPTLLETQRAFVASIFDPGAAWPDGGALRADGIAPQTRMDVYRNNVFHSLTEALGDAYPAVKRLVGDGFFGYAANAYLRANPPKRGTLVDFGWDFPEFLARFEPARQLGYLPGVARLELAWHQAYHAADAEPLLAADFQDVPEDRLPLARLALHPSCRFVESRYPVGRIWEANVDEDGQDTAGTIDLEDGPARLLVIRPFVDVEVRSLTPGVFALLRALDTGAPLGEACALGLAADPTFDVLAALSGLIAGATFTAIEI